MLDLTPLGLWTFAETDIYTLLIPGSRSQSTNWLATVVETVMDGARE